MDKRFLSVTSYMAGCLLVAIVYLATNWNKGDYYLYGGLFLLQSVQYLC